jgi:release factor glutamine methyltransferase
MTDTDFYSTLKKDLESKIYFLEDKPEENIESLLNALWLAACGIPKSATEAINYPLPELTMQQTDILLQLIEKRAKRVPLAYITGRQSFMGIEFRTDKRALIPRKETELLGRKALETANKIAMEKNIVMVIDVCCGAGNLGISLACLNQKVHVYATDISPEAVELTKENIAFLNQQQRVEAREGDVLSAFGNEFFEKIDLIVCNPPYISSAKVQKLDTEISENEPPQAFDGGMLGTKIIQKLINYAHVFLVASGWLMFEVGIGQGEFVMQLCERTKLYSVVESQEDEKGNIRVIALQK